ncbi:diguanylate cyclase domain-containing protein [Azospirillum griseum]|uniref:Diguanylate cyclase n=1 Tax=Azospirillum griseum TaxID=2496639 RepID=A0A3S0I0T2_9PROT|nr:diguanylate cyclase [Azospirillum griseum]RTR20234.1 diguanylate cyclase [Azospirillum griseum]
MPLATLRPLEFRATAAATMAVLVMGLALANGLFVGTQSEQVLNREVGNSMMGVAQSLAHQLDATMWARANQIASLARIDALKDPSVAQATIEELKRRDPTIAWIGMTNLSGTVLTASNGLLVGLNIASRPVHAEGLKGLFVGDVHEAVALKGKIPHLPGENPKFVDVSAPLLGADGKPVGVLAVHYSWEWTRTTMRELTDPLRDRDGLTVYILAADGTVLLGPEDAIGKPLPHATLAFRDGWESGLWSDGVRYVTGIAHGKGVHDYAGLGWTVLARQPASVVHAEADRLRRSIIGSGAALALLFSALGWFAAGRITRPLTAIASAAKRIGQGESGVEIPEVGGQTEVGHLSRTLRDLIDSLTHKDAALMRLEDIAYQDRLTTLPNRRYFEQYLEACTHGTGAAAMMYIDLDGFKPINDRLGHDAGDTVLRQVGQRLTTLFRNDDIVARLGGDEFAAILPRSANQQPPDAAALAARVIEAVNEPVSIGGQMVRVGCSIGIARWPEDSPDVATVLRRADEALYQAKRDGRNRAVVWSPRADNDTA